MRAIRLFSLVLLLLLALGFVFPIAAQDTMMMSAECGADDYTGNFKSIEIVDALTIKFSLCAPDPAFPSKVAFSAFSIHPSEYLEATGGTGDLLEKPIGTGPYKFERWDRGSELIFTRNDEFWGDKAKEPTLVFRWNSESAARYNELLSGTVDGIDNPGESEFERIANDPNLTLNERNGTNVFYIGMNNRYAPFDKVEVRQAMAYAIDKQRLVDNFYPPSSQVATQFMPPSIFGFTPEVAAFPLDLAKARELLDAAGYPASGDPLVEGGDGKRFEVTLNYRDVVRGYLPSPGIVATDIQAQLAVLGIDVKIEVLESAALIDRSDTGELAFYLLGWGADYPDATNFLDFHFGSGASQRFGDKSPEIVDVLQRAAAIANPDERLELYIEANTLIRDFAPMIPVAHGGSGDAFLARIQGSYASDIGAEQFALMEDPDDDNIVWMQNAEPIGLYCADESDGESLRACEQVNEPLLKYEVGTARPIPALATEWSANDDLTEWTFKLREGVKFHDGTDFDAMDVYTTYAVQWDAANPLHVGRDGNFVYFSALFGGFLNAPSGQ